MQRQGITALSRCAYYSVTVDVSGTVSKFTLIAPVEKMPTSKKVELPICFAKKNVRLGNYLAVAC